MYKITVDEKACIGCGACTTVSELFKIDEKTRKSKPVKTTVDDLKEVQDAVDICPVGGISVDETK
ncbi:MAG: ferredoxin [Nanoarchaeota archaeon]